MYSKKFKTSSDYFDWKFYISHYKDLQKAGIKTADQAFEHYLIHGKKEKRIINRAQLILKKLTKEQWIDAFTPDIVDGFECYNPKFTYGCMAK